MKSDMSSDTIFCILATALAVVKFSMIIEHFWIHIVFLINSLLRITTWLM